MLLVILGAGASYDSAPDHPPSGRFIADRPPLANDLFAMRPEFQADLDKYPECHPIVHRLRPVQDRAIETELERLQSEGATNPFRHRQLAAVRYYLRRMLFRCEAIWVTAHARGITNYLALIDWIRQHTETALPVCFVTFNYDTLLERCLHEIDVKFDQIDDYVANPNVRVVKLHGSVNWVHEIETPILATATRAEDKIVAEVVHRAPDLQIRPEYTRVDGLPVFVDPSGRALFPALAIPVVSKQRFECPDAHVDTLREFLPRVRKILIVGWRGTETRFLELLRNHMAHPATTLAVCGTPQEGAATLQRLVEAGVPIELREAVPYGFTEFMRLDAERFLGARPE